MTPELEVLIQRLRKPLKELINEEDYPLISPLGQTASMSTNGVGISANVHNNIQLGCSGAALCLDKQSSSAAVTANETQFFGNIRSFPSSQHHILDVNNGSINASLVPPLDPLKSARFTPTHALLTTETVPLGPTSAAVPIIPPYVMVGPVPVPVQGIKIQYLFGHNRVLNLIKNSMGSVYNNILKDIK